ncbi:MAG: hypothetical protein ABI836_02670 [Gemmatimonadota bacterium]
MRISLFVLFLLSPAPILAQSESAVRYLVLDSVSRLPPIVRVDLEARSCRIPAGEGDSTISAIRGEFQRKGQLDWAVLCVVGQRAQVLVFLDNAGAASDSFPSEKGHLLMVARPAYIIQHLQWYSEDTTLAGKTDSLRAAVIHDGIEDSNNVCCSTIHYWQSAMWQEYPGSD